MNEIKLLDHLMYSYEHNENIKIDCLWCGHTALSIEQEAPHKFQCFRCKESGNAFTLLRKHYEELPALKKSEADYLCSIKAGIKPLVLRNAGVKFFNDHYWIPVYNQKNNLVALHKYNVETNIVYGSPKPTSLTVLGLQTLTNSNTVYIAEGHWDYLTALPYFKDSGCDLLGTCGSYFSSNLLPLIKDRHIILLYDHDEAGKLGVDHVAKHIKSNSIPILSLSYLDWHKITLPQGELTDGFDIRDLVICFNS